ncbi:hypothetical protein QL285_091523 [Trifolium repens]|nr:hypothetical protein QL285_091523 [Trifolium repens]
MVYSIVCHLWKKWKMKKFLPLPPIPIRKSPQESSIDIQEPLSDSISEAEEEISVASTSVLESISANYNRNFSFGNFHSVIVPITSLEFVKPRINGCIIKIGEISCFLKEHHDSAASSFSFPISEINDELMKFPNPSNSSATTNLESEFVVSESAKKSNVLVTNMVLSCYGSVASIDGHERKVVTVVFATVFDPGGVADLISVARFSGTITLTLSMSLFFRLVIVFAIVFAGEFAVIVFDPGGNQLTSVFGELLI